MAATPCDGKACTCEIFSFDLCMAYKPAWDGAGSNFNEHQEEDVLKNFESQSFYDWG